MISMSIESRGSAANLCSENEWWTPRLAGPLIAAAVVRLTLLAVVLARAGTSALINTDTNSYLIPGRNLLLHGSFVADGSPDLLRTPGYALFLAVTALPAARGGFGKCDSFGLLRASCLETGPRSLR